MKTLVFLLIYYLFFFVFQRREPQSSLRPGGGGIFYFLCCGFRARAARRLRMLSSPSESPTSLFMTISDGQDGRLTPGRHRPVRRATAAWTSRTSKVVFFPA